MNEKRHCVYCGGTDLKVIKETLVENTEYRCSSCNRRNYYFPLGHPVMCPYVGKPYSEVPGYIEGYGCPVCKASGPAHVPIAGWLDGVRLLFQSDGEKLDLP